ncbi:hypothetical protein FB565_002999 [Actinoplanes lutulentus]|uniref:Uncharacterized protein n=1 Tax=Actinoplanes lutulentus TaxID=1287878 RepID=A0A327Z1Q4_9ACTN|nr:hypothetical protein [Actinoplanes lutulentus]MBB2943286.1 hypothetical protein [Actinoplanes lutulentus]RAK28346.1 hypothetical protein B0I29_120114 [Actinoplanes lutulentus]
MRPSAPMSAQIHRVRRLIGEHLAEPGPATVPVAALTAAVRTPRSAVYVTWDSRGRCRYVGSVHRPAARAAVADRLAEHARIPARRRTWYAVTVFPLLDGVTVDLVRHHEGWAAYALDPLDGSAHPAAGMQVPGLN